MPSQVARILSGYKTSLDESQKRYESLYLEKAQNAQTFYDSFFKSLIKQYSQNFHERASKSLLKDRIVQFFGSEEIRFAAIDGTCYKDEFGDYMIFFGASYGVRGSLSFRGDDPSTRYERWSPEQDVSMVTYIPIPFAELGDIAEEQFEISADSEKISLTSIHTQLMLLAEIYLAYDLISASTLRPKFLLWDQSMSGVLASTDIGVDKVDMVGYNYLGRKLTPQDVLIAYSHPYNVELEIPSKKNFRLYNRILMELFNYPRHTISSLTKKMDMSLDEIKVELHGSRSTSYLLKTLRNPHGIVEINKDTDSISINREHKESWNYTVNLFSHVCSRLFKEKDQNVLIFEKEINGELRERWVSPNDLRFLIAVGLRALIEQCWKHNVFFVGIAKDSASRYLSRNYLGAMRKAGAYEFLDISLPWTDRTFLELIPIIDDSVQAPWSTIEFDSVFMTLAYRKLEEGQEPRISGVKGEVVNTERLFARSLAQFYVNRSKPTPLCGHAIFVDRLIFPTFDKDAMGQYTLSGEGVGTVEPCIYKDNTSINLGQDLTIYLLESLSKNLYPEVIGYPDPLHKADWGAKSILKKVRSMIQSSGPGLRSRPLNRTFRQIRQTLRRV